jgi:hypothetical protein
MSCEGVTFFQHFQKAKETKLKSMYRDVPRIARITSYIMWAGMFNYVIDVPVIDSDLKLQIL